MSQGKLVYRALPGDTYGRQRALLATIAVGVTALLIWLMDALAPVLPASPDTSVTNITRAGHVYEHSKACPCRWK